jgi:hypothetical protein
MHRFMIAVLGLGLLGACGEDKGYGDPITTPGIDTQATATVGTALTLQTDTTNESALNALNALGGYYNSITGAKYNAGQQGAPARPLNVPEECVAQTDSSITWTDCLYGNDITVNGSVTRSGTTITADVNFLYVDVEDSSSQETDADASIDITTGAITGTISFDQEYHDEEDGFGFSAEFDGYYDVVLDAQGCAIGGNVEMRGHASAAGQSQTIWAIAEFGPECGTVVVR